VSPVPPVDPVFAAAVAGAKRGDLLDVEAARARSRRARVAAPLSATKPLDAVDLTVPGKDGVSVPIRVYRPAGVAQPLPALVYFHGGAFVVGDLDAEDSYCRTYASEVGCAVVAVDYRLAPEHPYPAAMDDGAAVLRFVTSNAGDLGVDARRVGVGGASAGGALAAAVAIDARDSDGPPLCFQFLHYPVLDDRLETASARNMTEVPLFARPDAVQMWDHYLGSTRALPAPIAPTAAPARVETVAGLPPAYLDVGAVDPLRDEGIAYAQRLLAAGIDVELHVVPGAPHGYEIARDAELTLRLAHEHVAALRRGLRA
jgi:acetyl esterase/lipase